MYSIVLITSQPDGTFELICRTIDDDADPLGTEWTDDPEVARKELAWWGSSGDTLEHCLRPVFYPQPVPEGKKSYGSDGKGVGSWRTDIFLDGELI